MTAAPLREELPMITTPATLALPAARRFDTPAVVRLYALETRYEFLKLLRQPHYSLGTIGFPLMFYVLFGLSLGRGASGPKASEYLLASYAVFGCVSAALFAFGVGVSTERASGWMLLKRAAPLPTSVYLAAKVLTCMLFGAVIVGLLGVLGVTVGGVQFGVAQWVGLLTAVVIGCIPFCLIGLALGYVIPPSGAPGLVNMLNLPLAFAGGLWLPYEMLPRFVQTIAPFVPQYHLGRLALGTVGLVADPIAPHAAALAGFAVLGVVAAALAYRRSDR
jgi:ABC-2 type transport system permease protein